MITNKLKNIKYSGHGGYTILELLFYISFFVVLSIVVINSMIIMTRAFRETTLQSEFLQNGSIMEQISRQIRQAYDISSMQATNDLILNTKDSVGANKTVEFKFVNPNIQFFDTTGSNIGNLNTPNIVVIVPPTSPYFIFTPISTAAGKAVKVWFQIKSTNDAASRTVDFYDTIVLRGSY